ncbi:TetR/AcrR family transcriptional regulator [Proteiniclasticum sp. SCR006]|uniref:TetR/AcrR family transcriptional regulator n=1 Tax=Proteiniclasticum aestuarii TaxID=2817862 RepID=A0A939KIB6_9CLOT|nr:TetR/AcrR family transcriptional regulator [Proteiniclasticum aestuarii]MBO1263968.1 TetR/AcrR family transcriptional regulator [Proteiniclasticum aestuarii]
MEEEKMTNRQKKALETKDKIYDAAMAKFSEKGLERTSIQEICREAKVSIGSFYNHFASKEEIIYEIFRRADLNFEQFKDVDVEERGIRNLILDYMDYYVSFVQTNDIRFTKSFYSTSNHYFVQEKRPMQEVLKSILKEQNLKLNAYYVEDADMLVDRLFMVSRGVIFHWCLKDGDFDLNEMNRKQMEMVLEVSLEK